MFSPDAPEYIIVLLFIKILSIVISANKTDEVVAMSQVVKEDEMAENGGDAENGAITPNEAVDNANEAIPKLSAITQESEETSTDNT